MKFLLIIILILLVFATCRYRLEDSNTKLSTGNLKSPIIPKDVEGSWYLNQWRTYHTLVFSNHTVFVDNNIDTVFTLDYSLSKDTLITWIGKSKKNYSKIIKLTKDTFVLVGLDDSVDTLKYSRIKRSW